jgi:hypothetical protein
MDRRLDETADLRRDQKRFEKFRVSRVPIAIIPTGGAFQAFS